MTQQPRILVVEDEDAMATGLEYGLSREGFQVTLAKDGDEALKKIRVERFEVVVLDVMMPKKSGYDVLRAMRADGFGTPVILLTGKSQEADKLRGFDLGADDYVTKPFSLAELTARVRARLKRAPSAEEEIPDRLTFGDVVVDLPALSLRRAGAVHELTVKEADMLRLLWRERKKAVSRRQFLVEVWKKERLPTTRTVDQTMVKLRQKVEADPDRPVHIVTVHGIGYRLDA